MDSSICDFDDDLLFEEETSSQQQTVASLQTRLDQYLTASELGRLAYQAGDIQLATDRFNLAIDIELQVEMESTNDFGVTGQHLRHELHKLKSSSESLSSEPCSEVLKKLQLLYERADASATLNPNEPKWYLLMAGALCVVNEWEKAAKIYDEGIINCPQDPTLLAASNRLTKLNGMMALLGNKADKKPTPLSSPKARHRPFSISGDSDEPSFVPRSQSFSSDDIPLKKQSNSPLVRKSVIGTVSITPNSHKRKSIFNIFKKSKTPLAMDDFHMTWSSDDLFKQTESPRERTKWKQVFEPETLSSELNESYLGSRTIENMRAINALTERINN
uniref:Uncharacterized protein n=1 Tax=Amphimedon queenslandica TaxID=400682 RepID=A0A1X7V7H0_AMPQE